MKFHLFISMLIFSLLTGCGSDQALSPLDKNAIILAFGDSLTVGKGTKPSSSYPRILEQRIHRKVINAGISGETTEQGLKRLSQALNKNRPELVILMEGGNDFLRNVNAQKTKSNLTKMINQIKTAGAQIVLMGVPTKSLFSDSHKLYGELADEHQVLLDDKTVGRIMKSPSLKSDPVHFNTKGYADLARSIEELLRSNGALP